MYLLESITLGQIINVFDTQISPILRNFNHGDNIKNCLYRCIGTPSAEQVHMSTSNLNFTSALLRSVIAPIAAAAGTQIRDEHVEHETTTLTLYTCKLHDTLFTFRIERTPTRFRYIFLTEDLISSEPYSSDSGDERDSLHFTSDDEDVDMRSAMSFMRRRVAALEAQFSQLS